MIIYQTSDDLILKNDFKKYNIYYITQFFIHKNNDRYNEIKFCLNKNVDNINIDKIYLLNEKIYSNDELGCSNDKINQININKRLEYSDVFTFINNNKINGYIIFANSDIYLDESINILHNTFLDSEKTMIALLRYEDNNNIFGPRFDSNDTWIFHSNFNIEQNKIKAFNFEFGQLGCDNKFCYLCKVLGYKIINCPNKIKTFHNHKTAIRDYSIDNKVDSPYLYVEPLDYSTLEFNNQIYNKIIIDTNYFKKYNFNDNDKLRNYLNFKINNNSNFIIPRISGIENNFAFLGFLMKTSGVDKNFINYLNTSLPIMKNNAGIQISNANSIMLYSDLYLDAFNNSEIFANWEPYGIYIQHIKESHQFIMNKFFNKNNIWSYIFDIFHHIYNNPWTIALKNKRILLITSFEDSIKEKIELREKIYGIDLFPECTFIFLKPPITNGSNESKEFNIELDFFIEKIKKIINDFDIALVSCGGYGNLVCNQIFKLGKSAIYVGGVLQMYFGIYGERWVRERKSILDLYKNEYWSRPKEHEKPKNYSNIEGSCYW